MKSRARLIDYNDEAQRIASVEAQLADILAKGALRVARRKAQEVDTAQKRREVSRG